MSVEKATLGCLFVFWGEVMIGLENSNVLSKNLKQAFFVTAVGFLLMLGAVIGGVFASNIPNISSFWLSIWVYVFLGGFIVAFVSMIEVGGVLLKMWEYSEYQQFMTDENEVMMNENANKVDILRRHITDFLHELESIEETRPIVERYMDKFF